MKKFSITFNSFVVSATEVLGDESSYDQRGGSTDYTDFVVKRKGAIVLRAAREHIICVVITEVAAS